MNLEAILSDEAKLPPSPQILPKLLSLLEDENATVWDMVNVIKLDAALTSQIFALSNSIFYGYPTPCSDLEEAFNRIGIKEIVRLVGIILSKRLVGKPLEVYAMKDGQLWEYSVACGVCMELLSPRIHESPSRCYTVGLLHSLGKVVIDVGTQGSCEAVFEASEKEGIPLEEAEREVLGFNNAQAAGALLHKWHFDDAMALPIEHQYDPMKAPKEHQKMACLLHIAKWIIAGIGQNPGRDAWAIKILPEAQQVIGLSEEEMYKVLLDVHQKVHDIKTQLLNL